jgi:5,10-methylenetetrahydromethanopterin reductase
MVDAFSICGTPDICMEKIRNLVKLGVTQFVVGSPIGPNVREAIDEIGRKVLPSFS